MCQPGDIPCVPAPTQRALLGGQAGIDHLPGAGDIGRLVGGQPDHERGHLLGFGPDDEIEAVYGGVDGHICPECGANDWLAEERVGDYYGLTRGLLCRERVPSARDK